MSKTKKRSPLIRVLSAFTALGTVTGALPVCPFSVLLPAYAEESGETIQIRDQSIRFDLNSGSLDNEKFNVTDGIAVLKDAGDPADTPQPEPPALSGLKFAGWTNAAGNAAELFEADSTYYASWSYDYSERTNPYSGLVNYVNHSNFYDFRGNNGNLKTTFGNNGYDIIYKLNNNRYVISAWRICTELIYSFLQTLHNFFSTRIFILS